jgi:hypothetical protein
MNFENDLKHTINSFSPISLSEMDEVKLMQRVDKKFVSNINKLPVLLKKALVDYFMLEINNIREQVYDTTYYDTVDYSMYKLHHNGIMNRQKVRVRKYVCSDIQFLEIKRKTNKGETIKNRIQGNNPDNPLDFDGSQGFLEKYTPYNHKILWPKLGNKFKRLTLVNKDFSERITIDYDLKFIDLKYHNQTINSNLCIVEIKRNRDSKKSSFLNMLHELKIYSSGFSKYCIGLAILNPEVKSNLFKQKIRELEKI